MAFAFGAFVATNAILVAVLGVTGTDFIVEDVPGPFEKAADVVEYADERLEAAARGETLPDPPKLIASTRAIAIAFTSTLAYQLLLLVLAVVASGRGIRGFARTLKLDHPPDWWRPFAAMIAAYVLVALYSVAADLVGIELLKPKSTVPDAVSRSAVTLALTGVLACVVAPLAEESFFRGLMLTGLLRWGVVPAFGLSALAFTIAHGDPGSIVPFFLIGLLMGWLYRRRGVLWDSIAFHVLFNTTSFLLLLAGALA